VVSGALYFLEPYFPHLPPSQRFGLEVVLGQGISKPETDAKIDPRYSASPVRERLQRQTLEGMRPAKSS
jgi:hypothetical protein